MVKATNDAMQSLMIGRLDRKSWWICRERNGPSISYSTLPLCFCEAGPRICHEFAQLHPVKGKAVKPAKPRLVQPSQEKQPHLREKSMFLGSLGSNANGMPMVVWHVGELWLVANLYSIFINMGVSENRVYHKKGYLIREQYNELLGLGVPHFQTNPYDPIWTHM